MGRRVEPLFLLPVAGAHAPRARRARRCSLDIQLDVLRDDRGVHFLRVFGDISARSDRERIFDARPSARSIAAP